jgi:CheY-like chemotaxis protein
MGVKEKKMFSILIVDDVPKNIQVLANVLECRDDYEIEFATSGKEALEWVSSINFDLILLDIMMPGMDGYKVIRHLKNEKKTREIPVIFLTAKTDEESIVKGFENGAVDYVTKPFIPSELLARVNTHIELKRIRDEQKDVISRLEGALSEVKKLSGLLPICAQCNKIRNDEGYWERIEKYISSHSEADFSHSICPDCAQELYPEYFKKIT